MPTGFVKVKDFIGCNFTDHPTRVADNELVLARNCWPADQGVIGPRMQQALVAAGAGFSRYLSGTFNALDDFLAEASIFHFLDGNNRPHIVMWIPLDRTDGAFFITDESLGLSHFLLRPDSDAGQGVFKFKRNVTSPSKPTTLAYNNELYIFLGSQFPGLVFGKDDFRQGADCVTRAFGSTWATFAGATGDQLPFAFGEIYKGVFALGGLPPPYESLVFFTQGVDNAGNAQAAPYSLLSTAKAAGFGFGDGDKLLRVMTLPVTGGAVVVEQYAIGFKQRSAWLMQGDPPTTTDSGTLVVTPLMRREGLVSPHAVCKTRDGLAWCSGRNVWLMTPGTEPREIGFKVKGFLEKCPQFPTVGWSMEFHDDVLYLNVPSPRGLVDGRDTAFNAGSALSYLPSQQLWCDLRNPAAPQWWGPQDVRASHMLSLTTVQGSRQLIGICPRLGGGGGAEFVPFLMQQRGDNKSRDLGDSGVQNSFPTKGGQVPSSVIQDIRFREQDYGDDSLLKSMDGLEVSARWDIGLGTAKGTPPAQDLPLNANFIADAGKQQESAAFLGTNAVVAGVNADAGNALIQLFDNDDGSGGTYSAALTALTLRTKVARNISIVIPVGWASLANTIELFGTDLYGNVQTEFLNVQPAVAAGGTITGVKFFLTLTNVLIQTPIGTGKAALVKEGPTTQLLNTTTSPAALGFTLGQNTLNEFGGGNPANLSTTFYPLVFFPPNSSRFLGYTFQPRLFGQQVYDVNPPGSADDIRTRCFWVKSITPRIRPIGRRPGGSFGG